MLTLNDGRSELWQWDTGRKLTVDADCTQIHFSNKFFGRSVDVDVFDGTAEIPDVLLQVDKDLLVWAFVGTAENGYTKISKVFKVNKRNKPADYVFTPTEQTTLDEIMERLDRIEESQDPDAIKNAVDEYLANNPIQTEEEDPTVPDWAKQPTKPKYTAQEVGAVATVNGTAPDENGNVEIEIPEGDTGAGLTSAQINALDGMFKVCAFTKPDVSAEYNAFKTAFGIGGEVEPDIPDVPDEPDVPEKTLTSISAVYSGGSVTAGTAVSALTGIVVTAHYSDGTSATVTGYTLSGTIAEGSNTVTVSYGSKTTTFIVIGIANEPEVVIDIPTANLMGYYDMRTPLTADNYISDLSGNNRNILFYPNNGYYENGYITRGDKAVNWQTNDAAYSITDGAIDKYTYGDTTTFFVTFSTPTTDRTPLVFLGNSFTSTGLITFENGLIVYSNGKFNNVTGDTQIKEDETIQTFAVSLNKNGNEKIYINGELKSDVAVNGLNMGNGLSILMGLAQGANNDGKVYNVAVYNDELTSERIAQISSTLLANAGGVV